MSERVDTPMAPADFKEEVDKASTLDQRGRLALLASEAQGFPWQSDGLRLVTAALGRLTPPADVIRQVIVFTGHMIDAPGRTQPRFPSGCEASARQAIRKEIQAVADSTSTVGLAGGACGGDILFHEECAGLGLPTRLRLTLPPDLFLATSVAHAGADWARRFRSLVDQHEADMQFLAAAEALPAWLQAKADYDVWQRTNLWLIEEALSMAAQETALIALWDREPGDGPGGTQHLIEAAQARGVSVRILPTKEICRL